jgi:hypothetical protein
VTTDKTPRTSPSPSTAAAEGSDEDALSGARDDIKAVIAFIRRRLPTVVEFADNVHREDYEVAAEDRATLARVGDDLEYALDKAEGYYTGFVDLWNRYYSEAEDREAKPDPIGQRLARMERYVRRASVLVGVGLALAVVHLALIIVQTTT